MVKMDVIHFTDLPDYHTVEEVVNVCWCIENAEYVLVQPDRILAEVADCEDATEQFKAALHELPDGVLVAIQC